MIAPQVTSRRLNLRLTPEDAYAIGRLMELSALDEKSDAVRASVYVAYICQESSVDGRIVLRNLAAHQQIDIYAGPGATMSPPDETRPATNYSILQVRLDEHTNAYLQWLRSSDFGLTLTAVVRRAMNLYLHILDHSHRGWQLGRIAPTGEFARIVLPYIMVPLPTDITPGSAVVNRPSDPVLEAIPTYKDLFEPLDALSGHPDLPNKGCLQKCKDLYLKLLVQARTLEDSQSEIDNAALTERIEYEFYEILQGVIRARDQLHPRELFHILHDFEATLAAFYTLAGSQSLVPVPPNSYLCYLWDQCSSSRSNVHMIRGQIPPPDRKLVMYPFRLAAAGNR
ncbi:MAG: hypothetical protein ABSG25_03925 [Bryobacteraceae bacterium]